MSDVAAMPTIRRRKRDGNRSLFIILMLIPAVAALVMFMYYPIEETFRLSLMRSAGLGDTEYTGFDNYVKLFANDEFRAALLHAFGWAFFSVVLQVPIAFFIAFALNAYRNKVTSSLRAIYYLASILPSAITAMIGRFVFSARNGVISTLAAKLNFKWLAGIDFLGDTNIAFFTVILIATWTYTGFYIVYLMARIEQIPLEIREAAELDGASGWAYARHIVIPMVSYPLRIITVLCIVGSMKVFELPYMITRGGPGDSNKTLGIILYNDGFVNWQYGKAAAVGVVIFMLSLIFTIVQFSLQRKEGGKI